MRNSMMMIALCLIVVSAIAQDKKDIFDKNVKVTWLGMDCSELKLMGQREKYGSLSDTRHFIDAWNDVMMKEKSKFNPAPAIGRKEVEYALEIAKEHNANLELPDLFTNDKSEYLRLKETDIERIVSEYDFKGKTGLGLMFVAETFSYLHEEASIWVTFIDMGSNKVILTERMHEKPGGSGVRNNWANSAYNVMGKLRREFPKWKKKYIG